MRTRLTIETDYGHLTMEPEVSQSEAIPTWVLGVYGESLSICAEDFDRLIALLQRAKLEHEKPYLEFLSGCVVIEQVPTTGSKR